VLFSLDASVAEIKDYVQRIGDDVIGKL
jgi:hypothetical protein